MEVKKDRHIKGGLNKLRVSAPGSASSDRSKGGIKPERLPARKDIVGAKKVLPKIKSNTERFDDLLEGSLSDLLQKPPSEVRIFLSSTFSDYRSERNWLTRDAIPDLRDFCAGLGLDFRVVDMRWGITDDATNEHVTETICQAEIANCKRVSLGPNFVAMLGDRFGYQPLPYAFVAKEFEILYKEAKEEGHEYADILHEWYKRDDNNIPPIYCIKPIRDVLPHFGDHTPGHEEARAQETKIWNEKHRLIHDVLRCAASSLANKGVISQSRKHDFFKSVTEIEVTDGILEAEEPNKHALCYMRDFTELTVDKLAEKNALRNIDGLNVDGELILDTQVITFQNQLKNGKIPVKLQANNIHLFTIPWREGGLSSDHPEHAQYLNKFCRTFVSDIKRLVTEALDRVSKIIPQVEYYTNLDDALHHSHFCAAKCEHFCGQEEPLGQIKDYLSDAKNRKPLTVYAESGVGKTSILAMAMKLVPQWFGSESIGIVRFLGTSQFTGSILDVLRGVMGQLADIFDVLLEPTSFKTNNRISKKIFSYLPRFLRNISRKTQQPIYIFLDSLDQLSPASGAYDMQWLPTELPPRIHIVLSVIPQHGNILGNLRKLINDEKSFIEVKPLPQETGKEIVDSQLASRGRKLTPNQRKLIMNCLEEEPSPLFLKLFLDKAMAWRSYTEPHQIRLETSVKEAITHLFEDLENKYGRFLISRAFGYITVGLNGLSELELEDVLSCDDAVLDEVFVYHDPPIEGVIRIPPLLWARIRLHVNEYLTERRSQGKSTLFWYHRQFVETAQERYTNGNEGRVMHRRLAELYLSENPVRKDITLSRRKGLTCKKADRLITVQPMTAGNVRMLEALPYHLLNARNLGYLKQVGLCNLKFLMTRMSGFSLDQVIKDCTDNIELIANESPTGQSDPELEEIANALQSARSSLRSSVQMPMELLARLKHDRKVHPHISNLLDNARDFIKNRKEPSVLPLYPCLGETSEVIFTASNAIITSISDESTRISLKICSEDGTGTSEKAIVYDAAAQKVLLEESMDVGNILGPTITEDGKNIIQVKKYESSNEKPAKGAPKKDPKSKQAPKPGEYALYCMTMSPEGLTKAKPISLSNIKMKKLKMVVPSPDGSMVAILYNECDLVIYGIKTATALIKTTNSSLKSSKEIIWLGKDMCVVLLENESGNTVIFNINIKQKDEWQLEVQGRVMDGVDTKNIKGNLMALLCQVQGSCQLVVTDMKIGKIMDTIQLSIEQVNSVCSVNKNKTLLLMSKDQKLFTMEKYDKDTLREMTDCGQVVEGKSCLATNDDGSLVLIGDEQGWLNAFRRLEGRYTYAGKTKIADARIKELYFNEEEEILVSSTESGEVCVWNWRLLRRKCQANQKSPTKNIAGNSQRCLSDYKSASKIVFSSSRNHLITVSSVDGVKVWDLDTHEKVKEIGAKIEAKTVIMACDGSVILILDRVNNRLCGWEVDSGAELDQLKYLHGDIMAFTKAPESDIFYIMANIENKFCITLLDMAERKITTTIPIKDKFENTDIELLLTDTLDYLVLKVLTMPKQLEILNSSEKRNNLYSCKGEYIFYALNLKKPNGNLLACNRQLSTIPCLGDNCVLQHGNYLVITRERITVAWDIDAGKCDQRLKKGTKIPQFYRPWWVEGESNERHCYGSMRCAEKSGDGRVIAMGSDDGWFMMYHTDGGDRLGNSVPKKKPQHQGPVTCIAISPKGSWAASYGRDLTLMFWNCADPNQELANIKLGMDIQHMTFHSDDVTLAVLGVKGTGRSYVHLFKILSGYK